MEDNNKLNTKPLSNSYKFSSSLLNRPFSSNDNKEQVIDEEIPEQDLPEHNMTNYNINNKGIPVDFSTSSIVKNNDSMNSSKTSLNATISFNKRDLISQFNNKDNLINNNDNTTTVNAITNNNISDTSNNIISSSSTSNIKKRKPFDKLSFHSEAQTNQNSNNLIEKNNTSMISNTDNGNNNTSILNKSNISDMEKSMILSSYKLLSKSTLEKAKLFNNQYKNSTPFWIKFFEEIENDSLKSNSSYYKVNNKSEYVKSLIEMVQRDADIYDSMNKNNATKKETQKSIKQILNESTNQVDKSTVSNSKKEKEDKNNIEIDNKLNQVLNAYDKLDEKNKKFYNNEGDYDTFKFNLITGGKFNTEKRGNDVPLEEKMKRIDEEEEKKNKKEQKKNEIKEYKTIDKLYFGDDYTFEDLNYDKIDFNAYKSETIKKLLELDKRLHKIDPVRYNTSINTELKKIQDEFNQGKRERMEKVEKETRELFKKYLEDSKETKRTIFDIKEKDETRIKYRDYLKELADQKKHKKQIEDSLAQLDKIIQQNNKKDISPTQKEKLKKELEAFHNTKEYQDKFENFKVPGVIQLQQVTSDISSFEKRNKQLMNELNTMKEQVEIESKKTSEETKKEEEKYNNEVVIPFLKYQKELDAFDKDNKNMIDKVNKLEEENNKEEEKLNEAQRKIDILIKQKEDYEKFFEEGDKLFKEEVKENNNEEKDDIDLTTKDELYKKYGLDDIINDDSEDKELEEKLRKDKEEFEKLKKEMDDEYTKLQQTGIDIDNLANSSNAARDYFAQIEKEDQEENQITENIKEENENNNKESYEEDSLE